jgi:cytochrome oxidase Cu insertion factor (SCO1/SenC/PrrC family)
MNNSGKLAIAFIFLVGGVLALVTAAARSFREPPVSIVPLSSHEVTSDLPTDLLTEYTLTQQSGEEFSSGELAGTPHVVNFFFASCPSYCRMQSMEVQKLAKKFGPEGVVFLSITCDPDNDSPAALQSYADMFSANTEEWKFLTGDMLLLRRIGVELYGVPVDKQTHSEHLIVIDKWGQSRGRFRWRNHPWEMAKLTELLPKLLVETEPPPPEAPTEPAFVVDEETGRLVPAGDHATGAERQQESPVTSETSGESEATTYETTADKEKPAPLPESETAAPHTQADP